MCSQTTSEVQWMRILTQTEPLGNSPPFIQETRITYREALANLGPPVTMEHTIPIRIHGCHMVMHFSSTGTHAYRYIIAIIDETAKSKIYCSIVNRLRFWKKC